MEDKGTGAPGESQENETQEQTGRQVIVALFNGLGVGLLLGLLLGLSVSPVVSGVIGTVTSLLVLMLGLNDKYMGRVKSIRIGAFGVFAVVGILSGIYIRSNNVLSPSLEELKAQYLEAGYTEKEALDFIAMLEFDVVPSEWKGGEAGGKTLLDNSTVAAKRRTNILFSSEIDIGQCYLVESVTDQTPLSEIMNTFAMAGGTWKELADGLDQGLPEEARTGALLAFRDTFCGYGSSGTLELKNCSQVAAIDTDQELQRLKSELTQAEEVWQSLIMNLEERVANTHQKSILITAMNVLCHE